MLEPMTEFPADDAPITEWLRPVSATMINLREATGGSNIRPDEKRATVSQRKPKRTFSRAPIPEETVAEIRRLALAGCSSVEMPRRVGLNWTRIRGVMQREGFFQDWKDARARNENPPTEAGGLQEET